MSIAIAFVVGMIIGAVLSGGYVLKKMAAKVDKEATRNMVNVQLFHLMTHWIKIKQDGANLGTAIKKRGYQRIAIYGMSDVGERLLVELQGSGIEIAYGIDRNAKNMYAPIALFLPSENLLPVDAVIVTAVAYFDEIEEVLTKKMDCPILSIEDLMFEV